MIPYPDDDYLVRLGKLVYAVGYLEWLSLGDLPGLKGLPRSLSLAALEGLTTRDIAKRLMDSDELAKVRASAVRDWLREAGQHLLEVGDKRNNVLHARPASHLVEDPRLNRRDPTRPKSPSGSPTVT